MPPSDQRPRGEDLRQAAEEWLADDPDPATRAEVRALLDADDEAGLAEGFGTSLSFGTAGVRGRLGAGPARMNRVVVRRLSAGLAARLAREPDVAARGVVVGRDARHGSAVFAADAAAVLAGAGLAVRAFSEPVPTPLVAFAVRRLGAAAGVVVTASHNPASDNGYKVYGAGGALIGDDVAAEVAAAAAEVGSVSGLPLDPDAVGTLGDDVADAYLEACLELSGRHERDLRIAYTPLHGVAGATTRTVLARAGFGDVHVVAEQAEPDPEFPTVAFPNPEEPGALDLLLALAADVDADLALAHDPDGDRIAAAVPDAGGWRRLSGDELGCLLAEELLGRGPDDPGRTVATTVVSSRLLSRIAAAHGVRYAETLTGFKYLGRAAADAEAGGGRMVLAYEQALGVMCGDAVRDKDGISAALVAAELAAARRAAGSGLPAALDELARRHGLHLTAARSVRLEGPDGQALVDTVLDRLSSAPPAEVAGVPVVAVEDRARRLRRHVDGATEALDTPPADLVGLLLADGGRLQVRPSGTEPLLKFYAEVVEDVAGGEVAAARSRVHGRLAGLTDAFVALAVGLS